MEENGVHAADQQPKLLQPLPASGVLQRQPDEPSDVSLPCPGWFYTTMAALCCFSENWDVAVHRCGLAVGLGKASSLDFRLRPAAGKGLRLCVPQEAGQAFPSNPFVLSERNPAGSRQGYPCRTQDWALPPLRDEGGAFHSTWASGRFCKQPCLHDFLGPHPSHLSTGK